MTAAGIPTDPGLGGSGQGEPRAPSESPPIELVIPDAAAMEALGARLAPLLRAGDLVLLDGELGAGKTTLTRGLGEALGTREPVTSPTFVLAREHPTASGIPLVHVDAYRLATAAELDDLDLDWDGAIVVVEWGAGKIDPDAPRLEVAIERPAGGDPLADDAPRHVRIAAVGERFAELLPELARAMSIGGAPARPPDEPAGNAPAP